MPLLKGKKHQHIFIIRFCLYEDKLDQSEKFINMTQESRDIINGIHKELEELSQACLEEINNKQFSRKSKLPFKLAAFVYALSWRMKECSEAALKLVECSFIHSSLMLIRSSLENASILFYTRKVVEEVISANTFPEDIDKKLMSLRFANKYWEEERSEHDAEYRAKTVKFYNDQMETEYPEVAKYYHFLCEFVHTNSDGVGQSFSLLDENNDKTFFGPQLNEDHFLFSAFVITLQLALHIFTNQVHYIDEHFEEFIKKCDEDIDRKSENGKIHQKK